MRILMCEPTHYDVIYHINPWMTRQHAVNTSLAKQQWQNLRQCIEDCGASVVLMPPQPALPDMVFTANAALVLGQRGYLARFKHPERQPERAYFELALQQQAIELVDVSTLHATHHPTAMGKTDSKTDSDDQPQPSFEGAGDALHAGKQLFLGYGLRSDLAAHHMIATLFPQYHCHSLQLIDPHFYHLDTCFCPLNQQCALYWPGAFNQAGRQIISQQFSQPISVPKQEAQQFACNAVVLEQHVILPAHCPQTEKQLKDSGFKVHSIELSEFIKAGGAAKCLTLNLDLA